jgi:hypothetical protein
MKKGRQIGKGNASTPVARENEAPEGIEEREMYGGGDWHE